MSTTIGTAGHGDRLLKVHLEASANPEAAELINAFKRMRDRIEFGPFFGEATDIVMEADKTLSKYEETEAYQSAVRETSQRLNMKRQECSTSS